VTAALIVVASLLAGGVLFKAGADWARHRAPASELPAEPLDHFADLVRRRVIVHTRDGQSIRGALVGEYRDCLVLEAAEFLREAPAVEDIGGRAVIERKNVSWLQVLADDRP
jgi:small nuclear ribonucleoprotein (snRNP)-like protein